MRAGSEERRDSSKGDSRSLIHAFARKMLKVGIGMWVGIEEMDNSSGLRGERQRDHDGGPQLSVGNFGGVLHVTNEN